VVGCRRWGRRAGLAPIGARSAGYCAVEEAAHRLPGSRADERPCDRVARIVHSSVHARVGDAAGQELDRYGGPRAVPAYGRGERERGRRMAGRERRRCWHSDLPHARNTGPRPVRPAPAGQRLDAEVHQRGCDADGEDASGGRTPACGPGQRQRSRDAQPQPRSVGRPRKPSHGPVERRCRDAGHRRVDRAVDRAELMQHVGTALPSRAAAPEQIIGQQVGDGIGLRSAVVGREVRRRWILAGFPCRHRRMLTP
jgi:hypothetical protein